MPTSEKLAAWRRKQAISEQHREARHQHESSKREWITIDGEGWGRDDNGRQHYRFMIAANQSGFQMLCKPSHRESLTTEEALDWLVSIQYNYRLWCHRTNTEYHVPLIGGFALGYDYAHILIDITQEQLDLLLSHQDYESEPVQITSRFSVKLTAGNLRIYDATVPWNPRSHTYLASIWDTFRYYQAAFLKVMKAYAESDQWAIIEAGKERRSIDEEHNTNDEILYCLNECRVHSRAMNDLSRAVHDMKLNPRGWFGPGSLAQAAMRKHRTKKYWKSDDEQERELWLAARSAYIGGRFETTGHGWLNQMYSHDIRSAYPAGMQSLPCLQHGTWKHLTGSAASDAMFDQRRLAVGLVSWHCANPAGGWGPYPTRSVYSSKSDRLYATSHTKLPAWPFHGRGWLWNREFKAGFFLTDSVDIDQCWVYEQRCCCVPFDWIPDYYKLRYRLKEDGNEIGEKVIKLVLNSMYGKIAQSVGNPPVPTWIWAGLITQSARSQLLDAIATNPTACVMVATDAVYSTEPLKLDFGPELGQWDGPDEYGRTLIIQAGFWRDYDNKKSKTRGIAKKYLDGDKDHEALWPLFESLWTDICNRSIVDMAAVVPVRYSDHIGLQRARQYGIDRLGQWTDDARQDIRFRVDKRPHLIGKPHNGWWNSAPIRTDRIGEQLELEVTISDQYIAEERSAVDKYFIVEQPDAAEWGYTDD